MERKYRKVVNVTGIFAFIVNIQLIVVGAFFSSVPDIFYAKGDSRLLFFVIFGLFIIIATLFSQVLLLSSLLIYNKNDENIKNIKLVAIIGVLTAIFSSPVALLTYILMLMDVYDSEKKIEKN